MQTLGSRIPNRACLGRFKNPINLDMVVHTCNQSTQKAGPGGLQDSGQLGKRSKIPTLKAKQKKQEDCKTVVSLGNEVRFRLPKQSKKIKINSF